MKEREWKSGEERNKKMDKERKREIEREKNMRERVGSREIER